MPSMATRALAFPWVGMLVHASLVLLLSKWCNGGKKTSRRIRIAFTSSAITVIFSILRLYGLGLDLSSFWPYLTRLPDCVTMLVIILQPLAILLSALKQMSLRFKYHRSFYFWYVGLAAPVLEEVEYRLLPEVVLRSALIPFWSRALSSSLAFGLVHVVVPRDRIREQAQGKGWLSLLMCTIRESTGLILQTAIFGLYCALLLRITESLWPVIIVHSLANLIGPPYTRDAEEWYLNGAGLCLAGAFFTLMCARCGIPVGRLAVLT